MKLTRTAEYALSALLQLGESPHSGPVSSHRMASRAALPERYFLQVLRNLVNNGLLKSTRGVVGGYSLRVPLSEISLLDVITITDGPIVWGASASATLPPRCRERVDRVLADVAGDAIGRLESVRLSELNAEPAGAPHWRSESGQDACAPASGNGG